MIVKIAKLHWGYFALYMCNFVFDFIVSLLTNINIYIKYILVAYY